MRAAGILMVMEEHAYHLIYNYFPKGFVFIPYHDKISFFFVLSGFLIGNILMKLFNQPGFGFRDVAIFWLRRWVRTVPLYILVITGLVLLRYGFTHVGFVFPWREYVFFQNFYYPEKDPYYFYPEGWSLAVEEWFYFLVPAAILIFYLLLKGILNKKQILLLAISTFIAGSTALRLNRALNTADMDMYTYNIWIYKIVVFRLDTIMFGVLAAFVRHYYRRFWEAVAQPSLYFFIAGMAIVILGHSFWESHNSWLKTFFLTQTGLITMSWLPWLDWLKTGKGFLLKAVTLLSKLTYAMFLLNRTPILKSMMQVLPPHSLAMSVVEYILYFVLVFISALLFHKYLEQPVMAFRERIRQ